MEKTTSSSPWKFQWIPTDAACQAEAEAKMLSPVTGLYRQHIVNTPSCAINTLSSLAPTTEDGAAVHGEGRPVLVLLHGFGLGAAQWVGNWKSMTEYAEVHAIDLPGFARSSRIEFSGSGDEAILFFIQQLEEWVKAMWPAGPPPLVLVGHSMGGYLAGMYALNYPERLCNLVLVDPFGVNGPLSKEVLDARAQQRSPLQTLRNTIAKGIFYGVNPLSVVRGLGPLGPSLVESKTASKVRKFQAVHPEPTAVSSYLYHCNAQRPSGETAFRQMICGMGNGFGDGFVAKRPLADLLPRLADHISLHFLYGMTSWIPARPGFDVATQRGQRYLERQGSLHGAPTTTVHVIPSAGHHLYVENAPRFNALLRHLVLHNSDVMEDLPAELRMS